MTKQRHPLTTENALYRVLGALGIEAAAGLLRRDAYYVRSISDPDSRYRLAVDDAIALDLAHAAAGHDGHPIFESYRLRLGVSAPRDGCEVTVLARRLVDALRESAQANVALAQAALAPDPRVRREALRELEEAIAVYTAAAADLRRAEADSLRPP